MSQNILIQTTDLVKQYKVKHREIFALNGISIEVKSGERVAVMGQSGSGKSTLMHMIGALDKPTSGAITVLGQELSKLNDKELSLFRNSKIGFIFQDFNLINYLSVADNITLPLRILGKSSSEAAEKANALLDKLGMADLSDRYPHQLSGGQKQRAAVARALIVDPAIILADEPTANLDEQNSEVVLDLIRGIEVGEDKAMVIVTHNHDIAQQFDRIIYLSDGKVTTRSNLIN